MSQTFRSIFARERRVVLPERETPLMRVLEPRVLLDAAALETALDVAAQAAHSDLAEAYLSPEAQARPIGERTPFAVHRSAAFEGLTGIVQEDDGEDEHDGSQAEERLEIVFVDGGLPDLDTLIAGMDPRAEIHIIEPDADGLAVIAATLDGREDIDAIHIMSHGSAGSIQLGASSFDPANMNASEMRAMQTVRIALAEDADILVYGCNFGSGEAGHRAATALASATGADVAASDDLTGNADLGGDWDLEIRVGDVETKSMKVAEFSSVLAAEYAISVTAPPTVTHPFGNPIGSLDTIARYENAVTFTPDGGGPTQTFDLVGQFVGFTGDATVSFGSETGGGADDLAITVTNLGPVDGGTGLSDPAAVTIIWSILDGTTGDPVPLGQIDFAIDGLFGQGGVADTGTGVSVDTANLGSYTLDANTDLTDTVVVEEDTLLHFGTEAPNADDRDQVSLRWNEATGLIMSFHTREPSSLFVVDGNRDLTFANGVTTSTRSVDADGSTPGNDYSVVYTNAGSGPGSEAGVGIVNSDLVLYDINDFVFDSVTVTLENPQAGDMLVYDDALAGALGLTTTLDTSGPETVLLIEASDPFLGGLREHFQDFVRSIAFRNDLSDAAFDRTTARTITVTFDDGLGVSDPSVTTITFAEDVDAITAAPILHVAAEDNAITRGPTTGLLSAVANPDGNTLSIIEVRRADATVAPMGAPFPTANGAQLSINPNGSFNYSPAANTAGSETFHITISDGAGGTVDTTVIFTIAPVADTPVIQLTLPAAPTLEDAQTALLALNAFSPDASEEFQVRVEGIPEGVIIQDDSGNSFRSTRFETDVDVTIWDLSTLRVLPVEDSDNEITIEIVATSFEIDGSESETRQTVNFQIDAVADAPELIIQSAIAPVDGTVDLNQFITLDLTDLDGSETLGEVRISNIVDEGVTFRVGGVIRPVDYSGGPTNGILVLQAADIFLLTMNGPNDGQQHAYSYVVEADSIESNPNGDVATVLATTAPVALNIAFDNSDDPVELNPDFINVPSGVTTPIDILANDVALDGGLRVIEINGAPFDGNAPYVFAGGQGQLEMDALGNVSFQADPNFSGTLAFQYTARDGDFDVDTEWVVLDVQPRWNISTPAGQVPEGGTIPFSITLDGSLRAGETSSIQPGLVFGTADAADIGDVAAAIAAATGSGFTFDGTNLTYTAPTGPYDTALTNGVMATDIQGTGTALDLSAGPAQFDLGFEFDLYGQSSTRVHVSEDGYLSLTGSVQAAINAPLDGTALGGNSIVAPFWDDLDISGGGVTVLLEGETGARTATFQWNATHVSGGSDIMFQAILSEANGAVEFRYDDVRANGPTTDDGRSATIGVQAAGQGTTFSHQTASVTDNSSLSITPPTVVRPQFDFSIPIGDDPDFEPAETLRITLTSVAGSPIGAAFAEATIELSDNTDPVANDDATNTPKNAPTTVNVITGLNVDTDAESHPLTLTEIDGTSLPGDGRFTLASGAIVTALPNGTVTYDPNGAFDGLNTGQSATETFQYTVSDGFGGEDTATVTVTIDGLNVPPTIELDGVAGGSRDVTVSYADTDGRVDIIPTATIDDMEDPTLPSLTMTLGGFIQDDAEEIGIGDVVVRPTIAIASATVTVGGDTFDLTYDGANTIVITGAGGGSMTQPAIQALLRSISYDNTATIDLFGVRTLSFTASDGNSTSPISVATIDVIGSNRAPDAVDDGTAGNPFLTGTEDMALAIDPNALLANDSDFENDPFSIIGYGNEVGGSIAIDAMGNVTFVPDADLDSEASFEYTVRDTEGGESTATVTVAFAPVNDAPVLDLDTNAAPTGVTSSYTEDGPATPIVSADAGIIDLDDTFLDGATIQFTAAIGDRLVVSGLPSGIVATPTPASLLTGMTAAGNVTLTLTGSGTPANYLLALQAVAFDTVSDAPATTPRTFDIAVFDGSLFSNVAQNVMTVVANDDAPIPMNDGPFSTQEDTSLSVPITTLMANDTDPDGTQPTFVDVIDAINGTVRVIGANVVFVPDADYFGPASFRYSISDGVNPDEIATVSVNVQPVNDAPVLDTDGNTAPIENTFAAAFAEDSPPVTLLGADFALGDVDDTDIEAAVVRLTNGQIGDRLQYGPLPAGTSVTVSPTGQLTAPGVQTVTLTGSASLADYRDWMATVTYVNNSQAPSVVARDVTFQVSDGSAPSNVATVTVAVTASNDAPDAVADATQTVLEDETLTLAPATLLANDTDPDGETPTFVDVDNAVGGVVTVDGSGNIVFTPDAETSGPASFDYRIRDAAGETDTQTVQVDVIAVNDAPVVAHAASPGNFVVNYTEGDAAAALVAGFTISDVDDAQFDAVEIQLVNGRVGDVFEMTGPVANVTVNLPPVLTADGTAFVTLTGPASAAAFEAAVAALTYRSTSDNPSENPRQVRITATDGAAVSNEVIVRINVAAVNDLPDVPNVGPFPTNEDTATQITFAQLTGVAFDSDGDPLTVSAVGTATGGTATLGSGFITFTPDADYTGPASFEYTISDGKGGDVQNTVDVTINPINDAPILTVGSGTVPDYVENGAPVALLDPALTVTDVDNGTLDSALVQLAGQVGDVVSHGPLPAGLGITIQPSGPLTAPGGILVTITGPGSPADYAEALRALTFASASEFPSEVVRTIQLAVLDGAATSSVESSTIAVQAVNDVPVAGADPQFTTLEDTELFITTGELLADVFDADLDPLMITNTTNVTGGSLVRLANGSYSFTPDADTFGSAGFDYTVSDGNGGTVLAHADIDVTAVDDAPTVDLSAALTGTDYEFTYREDDGPTAVVGSDILVDDVDSTNLFGATVTLTNGQIGDVLDLGTLPAAISASVVPAGPLTAPGPISVYLTGPEMPTVYAFALEAIRFSSVSQTPSETPRIIEVTVNDGASSSDVARTLVIVVSVNDAPVAADDGLSPVLTTPEDTPLEFTPLANDTDVDGDPLIVTAIAGTPVVAGGTVAVADGRVTLLADGRTLRFEPRANLFGTVTFDYTVSDGQATDDASATIEVISVNDVPVLGADAPVVHDEDTSAGLDPLANDMDADGDPLRVAMLAGQSVAAGAVVTIPEGEVRLGIDGRTITFTPRLNYNGVVTVPYEVSDGFGGTVPAELIFDVTPVNDPLQVVGTPPAVTYNDGADVSIPMDSYLTDPDGDAITYTATGLPQGLTIDRASGLIAGTLAPNASSTSPYLIVVTGDDGMGSRIDVSFQLTALNVAPVTVSNPTVPVGDGDIVSYDGAALFDDADGDVLAFTAFGLPAWLQIDAASGEVYGMVPFDASQFGPVSFTVTATDDAGAATTSNVSFVPSNPAPIEARNLPTFYADEGQPVNRSLAPFIRDGGSDDDTLTWTVTGLPAGVTFDPATLIVSGVPEDGTRRPEVYRIAVSVDDGQGGVLNTTLDFYVGDFSRPREDFDFDVLPDAEPVAERPAIRNVTFIDPVDDRSGTLDLTRDSGVVVSTVSSIDDLDSIDDVLDVKDGFDRTIRAGLRGEPEPFVGESGTIEPIAVDRPIEYVREPDGTIASIVPSMVDDLGPVLTGPVAAGPTVIEAPAMFADDLDAAPTAFDKKGSVTVSARVSPGKVFVEARDPAVSGNPVRPVTFAVRDGVEAVTQKIVRNGLASFGIPAEMAELSLTVAVELADGTLAVRDVAVDAKDGTVRTQRGPDQVRDELAKAEVF